MTLQKLASAIAFHEGKKKQEHIGNIRESLKILVDLEVEAIMAEYEGSEQLTTLGPVLGCLFLKVNEKVQKKLKSKKRKK